MYQSLNKQTVERFVNSHAESLHDAVVSAVANFLPQISNYREEEKTFSFRIILGAGELPSIKGRPHFLKTLPLENLAASAVTKAIKSLTVFCCNGADILINQTEDSVTFGVVYLRKMKNLIFRLHRLLGSMVFLCATFAFADAPKESFMGDKENLPAIILVGGGYSTSGRSEINGLTISGFSPFETNRISFEYAPQLDFKSDSRVSFGSLSALVIFGLGLNAVNVSDSNSVFGKICVGGLWLSSGSTLFNLFGNNVLGLSIMESHAFEWWFYKDNDKNVHFGEVGYTEELGIRANLGLVYIGGGAQFEVTNRAAKQGFFIKVNLLTIFFERAPQNVEGD